MDSGCYYQQPSSSARHCPHSCPLPSPCPINMDLASPVTTITGIGPVMGKKIAKLGVADIFDLFYHLPFRYEDRSLISEINRVQPGESVTLIGTLTKIKNDYTRRGKVIQSGEITDATGSLPVVWFNQPFLTRTLKSGTRIALYGKIDAFNGKPALVSPEYELDRGLLLHMGRLVPVYPETAGISSKWLRAKIYQLLNLIDFTDFLPPQPDLLNWKTAINTIHFPTHLGDTVAARKRLAFDELLLLQLLALSRREAWKTTKLIHPLIVNREKINQLIASLPFNLTGSQTSAIEEILSDLSSPHPMNRLLEGDVGSGKTVVAAIAAYVTYLNGFHTLILAPTQILAQQHFQTLSRIFSAFGVKVSLVIGSTKKIDSDSHIYVGTHALLSADKNIDQVGLVVIDEQHRFGVAQRALAVAKGKSPHILTMTATPIPRSMALTMYGDLDLSVLETPPSGRLSIKTWVVPEPKRVPAYEWIKSQLKEYHTQCFIVCPLIEESESLQSVKSAKAEYARLTEVFSEFKLGLLHGKLKPAEKDAIISDFRAGNYDILVSTPVVEVGIDIPNATIMVIEGAQRFGLAQLHQLRGRVGRSNLQSYCLLFSDHPTDRLKAMEQHHSGLELAEIDFRLRGPGEIYGTAQHGLPQFRVATYSDITLIEKAKAAAQNLLPRLNELPLLRRLVKQDKINHVQPN
jgi:ATP-dependent DNA helicase RecG